MDLSILNDYIVLPIVALCFIIGFVIKNYIPVIPNKFIPLVMLLIGITTNIIIALLGAEGSGITLMTIVSGGLSGLASTGVYELIIQTFSIQNPIEDNKKEGNTQMD